MDNKAHTPAPWRVYRDMKDRPSKIESPTGRVCTFHPGDKNVESNAKLIAAAPDLLEALDATLLAWGWLLDYVTRDDDYVRRCWENIYDPKGAMRKAHNAIAKAKGEVASDENQEDFRPE
jgi:hypothetical protein